jgi:hypothetical protein
VEPFIEEEISNIVNYMKPDRAPGPDGFNGLYSKNAGTLLKMNSFTYVMIFMHEKVSCKVSMAHTSI